LLKAAREIPSGVLEPLADFFPPIHCYRLIHAPEKTLS
jgi:hypothetical protein